GNHFETRVKLPWLNRLALPPRSTSSLVAWTLRVSTVRQRANSFLRFLESTPAPGAEALLWKGDKGLGVTRVSAADPSPVGPRSAPVQAPQDGLTMPAHGLSPAGVQGVVESPRHVRSWTPAKSLRGAESVHEMCSAVQGARQVSTKSQLFC